MLRTVSNSAQATNTDLLCGQRPCATRNFTKMDITMQKSMLAAAIAVALLSPIAGAETTVSETTARATSGPAGAEVSSSQTEKTVDEYGNVVKKSETYQSKDPLTGESRSSTSTSVEGADGTTHSYEQEHTIDRTGNGARVLEEKTTTTTIH